jgi:hypothetical protein
MNTNTPETVTPSPAEKGKRAPSAFTTAKADFRAGVSTENKTAALLAAADFAVETARKNGGKITAGTARAVAKVLESENAPDFAGEDSAVLRAVASGMPGAPLRKASAILRKAREAVRADGVARDAEGFARITAEADAEAERKRAARAAKDEKAGARERVAAAIAEGRPVSPEDWQKAGFVKTRAA